MRRETYTSCTAGRPGLLPCIESLPARAAMLRDASACRRCWLRPLIGPSPANEGASAAHGGVGVLQLHRGDVAYRKGETLHALFVVREGLVKSRALSYEGQDKITALHLPGEMFGLSAITTGHYIFDALAVESSVVCAVPFALLAEHIQHDVVLERRLFQVLSCASGRHQAFSEAIEHLDAEERIAALLLNLSERYSRTGHDPDVFPLPITRVEMANYAGLAHETVSRVVSQLQSDGVVRLSDSLARILRRDELESIASECDWSDHCKCDFFGC